MPAPPPAAQRLAAAHGAPLEGDLLAKLERYLDALIATNEAFNLTAVTNRDEAWVKHIADSLSLVPELRTLEAKSAIDVGSGGGLPGIPLACALPTCRFTLLEATGKKARFLEDTARLLGLANVHVVSERAEAYGQGKGRERFDVATSRAVSRLPVLLELTLPLVRVGGASLAIKGEQAEAEIGEAKRALELLRGSVRGVRRTETGAVIQVDKVGQTPAKYPRRPGEPKRSPL
jgi:16S rRNA (guanine527-N7)-methyltransferase